MNYKVQFFSLIIFYLLSFPLLGQQGRVITLNDNLDATFPEFAESFSSEVLNRESARLENLAVDGQSYLLIYRNSFIDPLKEAEILKEYGLFDYKSHRSYRNRIDDFVELMASNISEQSFMDIKNENGIDDNTIVISFHAVIYMNQDSTKKEYSFGNIYTTTGVSHSNYENAFLLMEPLLREWSFTATSTEKEEHLVEVINRLSGQSVIPPQENEENCESLGDFTGVTTTINTKNEITISWDAVPGAVFYTLLMRTVDGPNSGWVDFCGSIQAGEKMTCQAALSNPLVSEAPEPGRLWINDEDYVGEYEYEIQAYCGDGSYNSFIGKTGGFEYKNQSICEGTTVGLGVEYDDPLKGRIFSAVDPAIYEFSWSCGSPGRCNFAIGSAADLKKSKVLATPTNPNQGVAEEIIYQLTRKYYYDASDTSKFVEDRAEVSVSIISRSPEETEGAYLARCGCNIIAEDKTPPSGCLERVAKHGQVLHLVKEKDLTEREDGADIALELSPNFHLGNWQDHDPKWYMQRSGSLDQALELPSLAGEQSKDGSTFTNKFGSLLSELDGQGVRAIDAETFGKVPVKQSVSGNYTSTALPAPHYLATDNTLDGEGRSYTAVAFSDPAPTDLYSKEIVQTVGIQIHDDNFPLDSIFQQHMDFYKDKCVLEPLPFDELAELKGYVDDVDKINNLTGTEYHQRIFYDAIGLITGLLEDFYTVGDCNNIGEKKSYIVELCNTPDTSQTSRSYIQIQTGSEGQNASFLPGNRSVVFEIDFVEGAKSFIKKLSKSASSPSPPLNISDGAERVDLINPKGIIDDLLNEYLDLPILEMELAMSNSADLRFDFIDSLYNMKQTPSHDMKQNYYVTIWWINFSTEKFSQDISSLKSIKNKFEALFNLSVPEIDTTYSSQLNRYYYRVGIQMSLNYL